VRYSSTPQIFLDILELLQSHCSWVLFSLLFSLPGEAWGIPVETCIRTVDAFSAGTNPGKEGPPSGWTLEGKPGPLSKVLLQMEEGGFLALGGVSDSFGIRTEMAFDLGESPYLSWQWRVTRHPEGGDIRQKTKDDQAGQIYVIFGRFPLVLNYRALGYIWDPVAPVEFSGTSRTYSRMKYRVIRSGNSRLSQWIEESRDVNTDFKKVFQEEPPPVAGVMLFINTHFTGSAAECHYRNIFFCNHPKFLSMQGKNLFR
jgi:hypothetical protein